MQARLTVETSPEEASSPWTAAYVLMGLTFPRTQIDLLMKGIKQIRDSVTYMAIVEEGRAQGLERGRKEGMRQFILRAGSKRFGLADRLVQAQVELMSLETLLATADRIAEAENWDELLP